jgi:peptidoglycan hydrolase-like protein with peptidoglycan-binding domain
MTQAEASAKVGMPTVKKGDSGDAVRILQRLLVYHGITVTVDGIFGSVTETKVKAFQKVRKLKEDGIVGSMTWRELSELS